MKKGILILLLVSSVVTEAQSLKEALYGGKLKNQPGSVIRKGDDLTPKIDTTQKTAAVDSAIIKDSSALVDAASKNRTIKTDSAIISNVGNKDVNAGSTDSVSAVTDAVPSKEQSNAKDNNVLWKEYVNAVTNTLTTEVLTSKKIKRGTYYVTVSYGIGTDGQVAIGNVSVSPENAFLQQQIKDRLSVDTPRLNPVLTSSGTPRKVNKNYNFTVTKE